LQQARAADLRENRQSAKPISTPRSRRLINPKQSERAQSDHRKENDSGAFDGRVGIRLVNLGNLLLVDCR